MSRRPVNFDDMTICIIAAVLVLATVLVIAWDMEMRTRRQQEREKDGNGPQVDVGVDGSGAETRPVEQGSMDTHGRVSDLAPRQGVRGPVGLMGERAGKAAKGRVFFITAYCPCRRCCGPNAHGVTASGKRVTANGGRFIAADRRIPFGTLSRIPGYANGAAVPVLDRGGAITGSRLDVYFGGPNGHKRALAWGRQRLLVEVER